MSEDTKRARHYENMEAQAGEVSTSFHKVKGKSFGYLDSDQCFFLYSMSHNQIPPLCEDPKKPALNIIQAFSTKESALRHGAKLSTKHNDICLLLGSSHSWLPGCSSFDDIETIEKEQDFVDNILSLHNSKIESDRKSFRDRVQEKGESVDHNLKKERREKKKETVFSNTRSQTFEEKDQFVETDNITLPVDDDQKIAVVAIAIRPDDTDTLTYVFQFLRNFDVEDEADAYIRNIASERIPNFDIVTMRCGRYNRIELENSKTKSFYRDEKIQKIMNHSQSQKQEVDNFRQRCKDDKQEVPLVQISPNGVTSNRVTEPEPELEPEPEFEPQPEPEIEPEPELEPENLPNKSMRRSIRRKK